MKSTLLLPTLPPHILTLTVAAATRTSATKPPSILKLNRPQPLRTAIPPPVRFATPPKPKQPNMSTSPPVPQPDTSAPQDSLSPLEQEVLDEYARLVGNLNNVCTLPPISMLRQINPPSPKYPTQHNTGKQKLIQLEGCRCLPSLPTSPPRRRRKFCRP
jgi:hypothetical protein